MKKKNKLNYIICLALVALPTILSIYVTRHSSVFLLAATMLAMLFILKHPIFKHRENLWMFVIASFATIPINILLVKKIDFLFLYNMGGKVSYILRCFVVYSIAFAVEQIVLGIITRLLYKNQYKLFINI